MEAKASGTFLTVFDRGGLCDDGHHLIAVLCARLRVVEEEMDVARKSGEEEERIGK